MNTTLEKLKNKRPWEILSEQNPMNKIPIDIVSIAENMGIELHSVDFRGLEESKTFKKRLEDGDYILGAVSTDENSVTILYRNNFPTNDGYEHIPTSIKRENLKRRQRFTIAHEIGHCCLDMNDGLYHAEFRTDIDNPDDKEEVAANIFAGELLMPENLLEEIYDLCKELGIPTTIKMLANLFEVSKSAMRARIEYLRKKPESFLYEV